MRPLAIAGVLLALLLPASARAGESAMQGLEREIRAIVDRAGPAVVKVTAMSETPLLRPVPGGRSGDEKGAEKASDEDASPPPVLRTSRVGTGFLVSADGLVLTTDDVVAGGAKTATVWFANGEVRSADVLGRDDFFRVAVLKIDAVPAVEPLVLAADEPPAVASLGVFLGSCRGASRDISLGLVTGVRCPGTPFDRFDNYVAVNTAIHPGDAGGVFLDREGRVVGMGVGPHGPAFTVVRTPGGGIRGLPGTMDTGLLVPAADLRFAVEEIRAHGRVRRGILGIMMQTRTLEIEQVRPDSPAAAAGLRAGDVVVEIDGEPVRNAAEFSFRLRRSPVGGALPLTVRRDGAEVELAPTLVEVVPGEEPIFAGLSFQFVNGEAVVFSVEGRLADAGVRVGDAILALNGEKIESGAALLSRMLHLKRDEAVDLEIRRGDGTLTIHVE